MIGQILSHYKILEKLGEGGMGVVYKAEDISLKRIVALKFLPEHVSTSETDKARFVLEAQAAAALNHPNICTIYGIEQHEGKTFIAMEFIDGQTLREKRGAINFGKAIEVGIQIADGLAAAHEKGIVHRDIKPENIMMRKDGIVQIMDFGLAKLRASRASRLTKEGSTVGTAGYMSPEQVQGQEADHRSDIFSLGALLYELFTGELPFKGVHETALMYEIVNVDPAPMSTLKPEIDPELDRIVLECLQKDPDERYNAAKDIAKDLKRFKRESSRQRLSRITAARPAITGREPARSALPEGEPSRRRLVLPWGVAAILGIALVVLGFLYVRRAGERTQTTAYLLAPEKMNFYLYGNDAGPAMLSPDGRRLAFVAVDSTGKRYLYVRSLDDAVAKRLNGTDGATQPFWSPDNQYLGFFAGRKLKKIAADGGAPIVLCDAPFSRGGTWGSNGVIVFAPTPNTPLKSVSDGGGVPTWLAPFDSLRKENSHRWPSFLPDGEHYLYLARTVAGGNQEAGGYVRLSSIDGKTSKVLVDAVSNAVYVPGYMLYTAGTALLAQPFDVGSLELKGVPITVADGICYDPSTNRSMFSASSNGVLVYQTGTALLGSRLIFRDRSGTFLGDATPLAEYYYPRLSPDGSRIAAYLWDYQSHNADIWIFDLDRGLRTRFTFNAAAETYAVWSPDGKTIAFSSNRDGAMNLYEKSSSGAGSEVLLVKSDHNKNPCDISPDGKFLLYGEDGGPRTQQDLWELPLSGDRKPTPFLRTEFNEYQPRFSPDGRWVAYASDESGQSEVFIRSFTDPGGKWQVSISGGDAPCWRRDGKELYYFSKDNQIMAADIAVASGSVQVSHVRPLFEVPSIIQLPGSDYDVTADGKKFLMNVPYDIQNQTPLTLVLNWDLMLEKK